MSASAIDLHALLAFNAAYADTIDSDALEAWPGFFTEPCHYRITNADNLREGLPAGAMWADTRAMLEDRVAALRTANIYERHRYRHLLGVPVLLSSDGRAAQARTPFLVARIMATGDTLLFASGVYLDRFVVHDGQLRLSERIVVCDSAVTDTLMALPL
jgi:anthranilate 1,2-dioxygenase small subunit/terephthalate 1,2-dioxygenase oxygenase component beta subunit